MYKLVRGTLDDIEEKLNQACADGFSIMAREYVLGPDGVAVGDANAAAGDTFAFLMQRPRDVELQIECEDIAAAGSSAPTDPPPAPGT